MVPPDKKLHRISEYRCGAHVIRGAVRARDDGFDAYAIGHFQDGGLGEARSAVDLPVTGLGEASLLFGCSLGRKIGLITINPLFIPWHEEQVARTGCASGSRRSARSRRRPRSLHGRVHRRGRAQAAARRLQGRVGALADAGLRRDHRRGGLIATLFSRLPEPVDLGGPAYVSCVGALAKHTEMAVSCHQLGIGRTGRTGRLPARVPGGARRVHVEHGALTAMRIAIDGTRPLHAQPGTGHNRWHAAIPPLARVAPGDEITLETRDGLDGQLTADSTAADLGGARFGLSHPLTGPVYVEGAEPGDLLEIEILGYEHRGIGVTAFLPGFGFLADVFTEPYLVVWDARRGVARDARAAGRARSRRAGSRASSAWRPRRRARAGTAARARRWPRAAAASPTRAGGRVAARGGGRRSGRSRRARTAATSTSASSSPARSSSCRSRSPGALFSAGDLHFAQGDGEVCGSGDRDRRRDHRALRRPQAARAGCRASRRFETPASPGRASFATTGIPLADDGVERVAGPHLAARRALLELIDYLEAVRGLSREAAYVLCSVAADLRISRGRRRAEPARLGAAAARHLRELSRALASSPGRRRAARRRRAPRAPSRRRPPRFCCSRSIATAAIRIDAGHDLLPEALHAGDREAVLQRADEEHADRGAETPPTPPTKLVPPSSTAAAALSGMSAPTSGLAAPSRPAWITPAMPGAEPGDAVDDDQRPRRR